MGVSVHTKLFLGAGCCGSHAVVGDGQGHTAVLGSALRHRHVLAAMTPFSTCVLALGGHAVQERLVRAWLSREREQSLASKPRVARTFGALSESCMLVTSFISWRK